MRIAVSGPAGSGKTTLVRALSAELSLPVIEEGFLPLYNAQVTYRRLLQAPQADPSIVRSALLTWMRTYFDWCDTRRSAYERHNGAFIADRWELDIVEYWLHAFVQHDTWGDTRRLHEIFLSRASTFDLLVMLPMGSFDVETHNEDGLRRQTSRNRSLITQLAMTGLLAQVPASVARYTPLVVEPVEKRVAAILALLRQPALS